MKNKIYFIIMNQLIQYIIISTDNIYTSNYYELDDIENLVTDLNTKLTNDAIIADKQVSIFIDALSTIQHDMALPRMSYFKVYKAVQNEIKELFPDHHKYRVIKNIKTNKKKYLDISLTLVPKSYAKVIQDITKKLKLYYVKTYLFKDIYTQIINNDNYIVLHDIDEKIILQVNYGNLYHAMILDEFSDISLSQSLGILLAYFKISKETFLQMDLVIISDNPLEKTTSQLNDLKCTRLSKEELYKFINNNINKFKGFKL